MPSTQTATASSYQAALKQKHQSYERRIEDLMKSPVPDSGLLSKLKKKKLRLKEYLEGLRREKETR